MHEVYYSYFMPGQIDKGEVYHSARTFFIFDTQSDLFCQVSLEPCIFTNEVRFGENIAKLFLISYNIIMHESY